MNVPAQQKAQLRALYQEKLAARDFFSLIEKSSRLSDQFFRFTEEHSRVLQGRFVVSFYPFELEPQLNIEKEARDEPYRVSYVRIVDWESGLMEAHHARRDTPEQWEEYFLNNGTRIFQPTSSQPVCQPEEIAVVLVPGLGFTSKGKRLGRGAGFYDRFLERHPAALRLGIGFEDQIADVLPTDPWDQDLDLVLTDQARYEQKCYSEWKKQGKIGSRST